MQNANDNIPEDEMFLAKLIQNVKARGLAKVHGPIKLYRGGRVVAVCAIGAADLAKDTKLADINHRLGAGFEQSWGCDVHPGESPYAYNTGMVFDDAIDEEVKV